MKCESCGSVTENNFGDDFEVICEKCLNRKSEKNNYTDSDGISIFSFEGRINRTSFLFTLIPLFIISFFIRIAVVVGGLPILGIIFFIPAIWIAVATYVKRWHDLGHTGWMAILLFIPFINFLVLIYLCLWPGKPGSNKYGEEII